MTEEEQQRLYSAVEDIQTLYVSNEQAEEIQQDLRTLQFRDHKSGEAGILILEGETRSGKSQILLDYCDLFPDEPRAIVRDDGEIADRKSVMYMKIPDATRKNVAEKWLATLTNQHARDLNGMGTRRFDIEEDIVSVARAVEHRLSILDETHQCIHRRDITKTEDIAIFIKDLVNKGIFSIVLSGTREMRRLLDANAELEARVLYEHVLEPFDWDAPSDRALFFAILETWDNHLRDTVFGRLSGLTERATAWAIHLASRGYRGIAANLVESAGIEAVRQMALGETDRLNRDHLAKVFAKSPQRRKAPKAFDIQPPSQRGARSAEAAARSDALDQEVNGIQTRLRGRTRRTNRHGNFRP